MHAQAKVSRNGLLRAADQPPRFDSSPLGTILDGRYRVLSLRSEGAPGNVYLGERLGIGRRVAIEFPRAGLARNAAFAKPAGIAPQALGRISHPHCVSVIDFGNQPTPYLVTEVVEGRSLSDLMNQTGPLPFERAVRIARQILAGLAHAHGHRIVHRNIKPENIILESATGISDDHVRILGFGQAKLLDGPPGLTAAVALDERSDIHACGALLYEMLTGHPPFDGARADSLASTQMPPPPLRTSAPHLAVPDALEQVVHKALARLPEDRFASALQMLAALEDADADTIDELDLQPLDEDASQEMLVPDSFLATWIWQTRGHARRLWYVTRDFAGMARDRVLQARPLAARTWARVRPHAVRAREASKAQIHRLIRAGQRGHVWWRALPRPTRQLIVGALAAFLIAFGLVWFTLLPTPPRP
jgi:hypothetical protein